MVYLKVVCGELVVADLHLCLDLLLVAVLLSLLHALLLGHVGARQAGLLGDVGNQAFAASQSFLRYRKEIARPARSAARPP